MEEFKLILPTKKYLEKVEKYKQNMINAGSGMDGTGNLRKLDAKTWLKQSNDYRLGKNLPEGFVTATQYICVKKSDDKIVGMIQIRHELNDFLLNYGGHIGYSIAINERGKGYSKIQLKLGLEKCKKLGIKKVLITCKDYNTPSKRCILANGGVYEDTRTIENWKDEGNINLERYWITLK